jgi:replicative DNA helicase
MKSAVPAYIASLADGVPRATNVEYYAKIVKEKSTLRNLIYAASKILTNAYEADQESDIVLDEAESAIFAVADDRLKAGFVQMRDLVKESFPKIEQLFEQKRLITGVPTGFVDLDEMTRGLQGGDLIIVAARPSMGKTSLVLNIAPGTSRRNPSTRSASSAWKCRRNRCFCVCSPAESAGRRPSSAERCDWRQGLRPHLART